MNGSLINRVVYFSIKNPASAKRLVDLLVKSNNDSLVLPFIDYPGPISREILSRRFSSLTVCERDDSVRNPFQAHVEKEYPDKKIHIYSEDLFDLSFKAYCHKAQKKCSDIIKESASYDGEKQINHVKFLVPLLRSKYEAGFFRNLYYQFSLKIGLCSSSLVHYYFLVSDRQYNCLDAKPSENFRYYRSPTILYNTIFNIHRLESFDLENCFNISLRKIQKTSDSRRSSYRKVHLIWLEPRVELINNLTPRSFMEFRFLVNQTMHKRTALILPLIEKWFDKCDQDLKKLGITSSTRSGDLNRDQYYELYIYLKNRPDFGNSIFLQAAAQAEENILSMTE